MPQNRWAQPEVADSATTHIGRSIAETSPTAVRRNATYAIPASTWNEDATSREMRGDIRRTQIVHRINNRGTPDLTHTSEALQDMFIGAPHPWSAHEDPGIFESMFIKYIRIDHKSLGVNDASTAQSQAWSVADFVFEQMPCPWKYYDTRRTTNVMQPEWYKPPPRGHEKDAECGECWPKELTGTMQTIPMMIPVTTIARFYPRVALTPEEIQAATAKQDCTNGLTWQGDEPGVWLFEGMYLQPLHGKTNIDGVKAIYEATLLFRSDHRRKHMWYRPKQKVKGFIIDYPEQFVDSYYDMHDILPLKHVVETSFDDLLPIDETRCNPDSYPALADLFS